MARTKEILEALKVVGPDEPVEGRDAIRAWFCRYGHRKKNGAPLSWDQLKNMQRRVGYPLGWHTARRGRCKGLPISSHYHLLVWCIVHDAALGPPNSKGWKPSPRTLRARRQSAREASQGLLA